MNRKTVFSLLLTAAMVLPLSACGSTAADTAPADDTSAETEVSEETAVNGTVVTSDAEAGTAAAELADLFNGGWNLGSMGSNENGTIVNFYNDDHTEFRQAACTMNDEQSSTLFNIEWDAEDYDQQVYDVLASCDDLAIITPDLPDMTEYEAFEGRTIGEMEDAGFDLGSYDKDADGRMVLNFYVYTDEGDAYDLRVIPAIADDDDTIYDDESIRDLTAEEILFWNFG